MRYRLLICLTIWPNSGPEGPIQVEMAPLIETFLGKRLAHLLELAVRTFRSVLGESETHARSPYRRNHECDGPCFEVGDHVLVLNAHTLPATQVPGPSFRI